MVCCFDTVLRKPLCTYRLLDRDRVHRQDRHTTPRQDRHTSPRLGQDIIPLRGLHTTHPLDRHTGRPQALHTYRHPARQTLRHLVLYTCPRPVQYIAPRPVQCADLVAKCFQAFSSAPFEYVQHQSDCHIRDPFRFKHHRGYSPNTANPMQARSFVKKSPAVSNPISATYQSQIFHFGQFFPCALSLLMLYWIYGVFKLTNCSSDTRSS